MTDKTSYTTIDFFEALFKDSINPHDGYIELRIFNGGQNSPECYFAKSVKEAAAKPFKGDVYFGVAPRSQKSGKKESVQIVTCLWADVDCGSDGHKKQNYFSSKDEAIAFIREFEPAPSIIVDSGGGYHLYWLLIEPVSVSDDKVKTEIESLNKTLAALVHGDSVHDIARIMRVPGTMNMKIPGNPRPCKIVSLNPDLRYSLDTFKALTSHETITNLESVLQTLPKKYRDIVYTGNHTGYASRSESDHAVICAMVNNGISHEDVFRIFAKYAVGEKYREKGTQGKQYLEASITKACNSKVGNGGSKGRKFDPTPYVIKLLEFDSFIFEPNVGFYQWDARYYKRLADEHIRAMIDRALGSESSTYRRREVFEKLKLHEAVLLAPGQEMNPDPGLLNLQNDMFDIGAGRLLDHDEKYLSTIPLEVNYDRKAKCPRWSKFVDEILNTKEDRLILQEIFGYTLTTETKAEKAFFFVGNGSNGKSVVCDILIAMIGKENTSSLPLKDFGRSFHTINLKDKLLNIATDIDAGDLHNSGDFKTIISGEQVQDAFKYRDMITFRPFVKLVFAMNTLPRINDTSHGLFRRIIILEFPNTFSGKKCDRNLKEKLIQELDGIFFWALEGLNRLRQNDWNFSESSTTRKRIEEYRKHIDPVLTFVDECCEIRHDANAKKQDIYLAYQQWAGKSGIRKQASAAFFKNLYRNYPEIQETRPRTDGGRVQIVHGIGLCK